VSHPGQLLSLNKAAFRTRVEGERSKEEGHMKAIRFLVFRVFLLIAFMTAYLCLLYGQEHGHVVPIARNTAWNDLVIQVNPEMGEESPNSPGKELLLIQSFLAEHKSEAIVGTYDITVLRAIDEVRARFQKADKDLETINNELSYKEVQVKLGR
jgi:hypothetical protein